MTTKKVTFRWEQDGAGGDPRNSRAWPKVSGVSRDEGHSRALLVFFAAEPTDDEVRAVHDTLAAAPTAGRVSVETLKRKTT